MKKLLASCLLLVSCGASTTTSTGASIPGSYGMTGTLDVDDCGGCPKVGGVVWSVAKTDSGWLLTRDNESGPATVAGDTLNFTTTKSATAGGCTASLGLQGSFTITQPGFSGHMALTVTPPCDGTSRASCHCDYSITGVRQ